MLTNTERKAAVACARNYPRGYAYTFIHGVDACDLAIAASLLQQHSELVKNG
jgi:hypothetical protein